MYYHERDIEVDLMDIDILVSPIRITGRRVSNSQISKYYGVYGAATHSSIESRPGSISELIFIQLQHLVYEWNGINEKSFIEVYPHTGIIELFNYNYRLAYKFQKRDKYWKGATPEQSWVLCSVSLFIHIYFRGGVIYE